MNANLTIFSDCDFFAGCENVISVMLNSEELSKRYDVTFIYRFSKSYKYGLFSRIDKFKNTHPIILLVANRATLPEKIRDILLVRAVWRCVSILTFPVQLLTNCLIIFVRFSYVRRKDIFYVNNGGYPASKNALLSVVLARIQGFDRVILSCNNTPAPRSKYFVFRVFQSTVDKLVGCCATHIVVASSFNKQALAERRGFNPVQIRVLPNGIESKRFNSKQISISRQNIVQNDSPVIFGIIGVHEERKGHLFLLAVLKDILGRGYTDFKLIIEGSGPQTPILRDYIRLNSLEQHIEFVNCSDVSYFYSSIHVLIVPSLHSEDLPNVISEAMLFGVPVIGSNLAGIPTQIEDGKNGLIFPVGDSEGLSGKLIQVLDNHNLINHYKKSCVAVFGDKFSSEKYIVNLMNMLGD